MICFNTIWEGIEAGNQGFAVHIIVDGEKEASQSAVYTAQQNNALHAVPAISVTTIIELSVGQVVNFAVTLEDGADKEVQDAKAIIKRLGPKLS